MVRYRTTTIDALLEDRTTREPHADNNYVEIRGIPYGLICRTHPSSCKLNFTGYLESGTKGNLLELTSLASGSTEKEASLLKAAFELKQIVLVRGRITSPSSLEVEAVSFRNQKSLNW